MTYFVVLFMALKYVLGDEVYRVVATRVDSCRLVGRYKRFGRNTLSPEGGTRHVSPKRRYLPTSPHGVTTQKNFATLTAVITSNLERVCSVPQHVGLHRHREEEP